MPGKLAEALAPGDVIYGRRIKAIRAYQVPARVLHDSVAAKHPDGLPGFLVDYVGGGGITLFAGDLVPEEESHA
jgi:hypothetical protein